MRYAVYYTPAADHPLTRAAVELLQNTNEPRRYGFHATLKAPFRLKADCQVEELEEVLRSVALACAPCRIGTLKVSVLRDFCALVPVDPIPEVLATAARIVEALDGLRAPMNESELSKRLRGPLNEAERAHLANWGYPYVFDQFRFHMTLTDRLAAEQRQPVQQQLEDVLAPHLTESFELDAVYLLFQVSSAQDFQIRSRFPLG